MEHTYCGAMGNSKLHYFLNNHKIQSLAVLLFHRTPQTEIQNSKSVVYCPVTLIHRIRAKEQLNLSRHRQLQIPLPREQAVVSSVYSKTRHYHMQPGH